MSTIIIGTTLLFGIPDNPPKLPKGFSYLFDPRDWLIARDESGGEWYVHKDKLVECKTATADDEARTFGRLKIGQRFMAEKEIALES